MSAREEIFECLMPWAHRPAPGEAESANEMLDAFAAEVRAATLREAAEIAWNMSSEMRSGDSDDYPEEWSSREVRDAVASVGDALRGMAEES